MTMKRILGKKTPCARVPGTPREESMVWQGFPWRLPPISDFDLL